MKRLGGLYNEFVYVCFTSKALRGVYHEALHVVYDETFLSLYEEFISS